MSRRPLYAMLVDHLRTEIAAGRLRAGDRIPNEVELARAHRVSRITVRHALSLLRDQGLIERFPRRGSFVSRPSPSPVWTISSIEDVVQVGAETDVTILDWGLVHDPLAARHLSCRPGERVARYRGVRSDRDLPVYYVEAFTPMSLGRQLSREDFGRSTLLEMIENKLGLPVTRGLEEIRAGAVDRVLARRLGVRAGSPVLILELTYYGVDGRALEYTRLWYRADKFRRRNQLARRGG